MQIKTFTPNLMVCIVAVAVMYYTHKLGFQMIDSVPAIPPYDWAMVSVEGVALMFQSEESIKGEFAPLKSQSLGGGLSFYIRVTEIKNWYERLKNKVTIVNELRESSYGMTEFSFQDLNGFVLTFAENLNPPPQS